MNNEIIIGTWGFGPTYRERIIYNIEEAYNTGYSKIMKYAILTDYVNDFIDLPDHIKNLIVEVFVGPNSNDCGLSVGILAGHIRPERPIDITYKGIPVLDSSLFQYYFNSSNWWKVKVDITQIANDLMEGKIIGVVRGRSEHGPRALGNRSILCNPSIPEMKDILNSKVKHREWYRPFAPVVRLEDVSKYFEWNRESRWMSFCPNVREEWKEKLKSITHVDGTARVQTVTREQNEWIYDLLTEFEKVSGIGVLLNTSFNVAGKPILSTINEAISVFENSDMDLLVYEDNYIRKNKF